MEIVSVPIIAFVVLGIMQLLKGVFKNNEKFLRIIPILAAVFGALIGVIVFFSDASLIPADNWFLALIIGAFSGLSATGIHQSAKQLNNKDDNETPTVNTVPTTKTDDSNEDKGEK